MIDAHRVELPCIRDHLDNALGVFPQPVAVDGVCEQAFEDVHPLAQVDLQPKGAAKNRCDLGSQVNPLDAFEAEVHQLGKFPGDSFVQIGALREREDAELARSEVSVG